MSENNWTPYPQGSKDLVQEAIDKIERKESEYSANFEKLKKQYAEKLKALPDYTWDVSNDD